MSASRSKKVKVIVRTRPTEKFAHENIDLRPDGRSINLHVKREERHGVVNNQILDWAFKLDGILHHVDQEIVFDRTVSPLLTRCLNGYNGTMLCYGQTGAGKTYTMTGATENYTERGVIPRSLQKLYKDIEDKTDFAINVRISYLEIYNEQMFDLLSTQPFLEKAQPMSIGEDEHGVYVKGLSSHLAQSEEEALNLLFEGETNRMIAQHSLNAMSSRSHCIFILNIETRSRVLASATYRTSKLNFVDLAGSERLSKTMSTGKVKEEAMYINKSLTFLEQCVIALADKRRDHVPFRQSKLTHVLKDSIGGVCDTVLIANIWAEATQLEETVSTLRFATRMMCVSSEPIINEQVDPALMVKKLEKDIYDLKRELAMHDTLNNRSAIVAYEPLSEQQKFEIKQQVKKYIMGDLDEVDIVNLRQIQGVYDAFREIYQSMELDIESRFRDRYALIDKAEAGPLFGAQVAASLADEGITVGVPDGSNFGVGVAPNHIKASDISSITTSGGKRRAARKAKDNVSPGPVKSPAVPKIDAARTPSPVEKKEGERTDADTVSPVTSASPDKAQIIRPSTPPTRAQAFEEFKQERGKEINRIFTENQDILSSKKREYQQLARSINSIKSDIDESAEKLERLKQTREAEGFTYNEDGEAVISEEEFHEIVSLKSLKGNYRMHHDELKTLKSEIVFCQKLVDQCRQKLLQEFDIWYSESFLLAEDPTQTSQQAGYGHRQGTTYNPNVGVEDEGEKFDIMQEQLMNEDSQSVPFNTARMRVDRRKTNEGQAHPRKPGTPLKVVRNKPPSQLEIQAR